MGNENKAFLRTTEFLWQEGHTLMQQEEDAEEETKKNARCLQRFC